MYNKLIEVESQALFPFTFFPKQFAAEGSQCFLSASTLSGMLCSPPWAGLQACLRSCLPFRFPAGLGCCVSGLLVFHPGCCVCLASCVPACLPPCLPASKAKTENEFQSAISATVWGLQFFFWTRPNLLQSRWKEALGANARAIYRGIGDLYRKSERS